MTIEIKHTTDEDASLWDEYVLNHPQSNVYQLFRWRRIIGKTYGHNSYYLMASEGKTVKGVLPLIHLKHFLFANAFISIPFFDMGGILSDNEDVQNKLFIEAVKMGKYTGVSDIEIRHLSPVLSDTVNLLNNRKETPFKIHCTLLTYKTRMIMSLPESPDALMESFKSKLRSQIKKPMKEGLTSKIGGKELLDAFYSVFSVNMKDLGSPIHSRKLMGNVLNEFNDQAKIVCIYKENIPIAASIVISYKDTLENPWASSLREYSRYSPNMLLYWKMMEYACKQGLKYFDFGRSTPDEGTYKFKVQWGAEPEQLYWYYFSEKPIQVDNEVSPISAKRAMAENIWKKLPLKVTTTIGPMIRGYIGL